MVKAGGRANWNKTTGFDGSSASSKSSSASPSSPTRRLKKGGKRRRRLCYKEGCTLCPSFGYVGSVAVSCSRHKKEGMRNLTARRCQHVDCFTAANFGIPGDKPRFCLAHSTKDMVNQNKPRGWEDMTIIAARSSRRITKVCNDVYDGNNTNNEAAAEAAAEADDHAWEGSTEIGNCPVSGGKGILMCAVRSGLGNDGADEGDVCELSSPRTLTNDSSLGSRRSSITSVLNDSPVPSMTSTSRELRSNGVMSQKHSLSSMPVLFPMAQWESESMSRSVCRTASAAFVSREDGLDGPSAGVPEEKPSGGVIGVASGGNGRRVLSGNVEEDLQWAIVPREPYRHDDIIVAHRVETDDFEKHLLSNGRDVPGGVPDRRGGVNAPFDLSFAGDVGNSGDIMNGGGPSLFMDGLNSLDHGDEVDSDTGCQIGATLEEILGVEPDDAITDVCDSKERHKQEPLLWKCSDSSVNGSVMWSSAGLSFNGLLPTLDSVIGVGGIRNDDGFYGNGNKGGGGACLSSPQTRHQDSLEVPSGNFSSPSGFQHSTASSAPLLTRFGLAIVPNSGNSSVTIPLPSASQINMGGDVGVAGGMPPSSWSGVMGASQQGDGGSMGCLCHSGPLVGASSSFPVHVAMGS